MPLRIFEPRYLQLMEEAKEEGITFGIPFVKDDEIMDYGCEVKLQQVVAESEQGRKVVTVECVSLIKINSFTSQMTGKLYAGGNVETLPTPGSVKSNKLINQIIRYTEKYDSDFLNHFEGKELNHYDIIRSLKLSSEDKYRFLLMENDAQREQYLAKQIQYLTLIRQQEMMLDDDFHLN